MSTTLISPGVDVTITDDSAYASTGEGTTPLFIIGTHENKTTPSGAIASGTLESTRGVLYNISSQRQLVQTFGNPIFYTNNGTPVDGYELNEYGLLSAYSFLAAANNCYVIRGGIDYSDLVGTTTEPRGEPVGGTYWLNTSTTSWGINQSNGSSLTGSAWKSQSVSCINSASDLELIVISTIGMPDTTTTNIVGTTAGGNLVINGVTIAIPASSTLASVVTLINQGTAESNVTAGIQYIGGKYYLVLTQENVASTLSIDFDGTTSGSTLTTLTALGLVNSSGTDALQPTTVPTQSYGKNGSFAVASIYETNVVYQKVLSVLASDPNASLAQGIWYIVGTDAWSSALQNNNQFYSTTSQKIPSGSKSGDVWMNISQVAGGINFDLQVYNATTGVWTSVDVPVYQSMTALEAAIPSPVTNQVAALTPYVTLDDSTANTGTTSTIAATVGLVIYNGSYWTQLNYVSSDEEPTSDPEVGTLWYNNTFIADIMINQGGDKWVGYKNYTGFSGTDPNGPILAGSQPTTQSDGTPLVQGDIWINTSDTENYPLIYRFSAVSSSWTLIDNTDHITPNGIVFGDARADDGNGSTTNISMLVSDFVDPDAPDPELYPDGTLLFNTRYSTYNIKEWQPNYFNGVYGSITENGITTSTNYTAVGYTVGIATFDKLSSAGRWVTVSGNNSDGSPIMGRKAQRSMIVTALKSAIESNQNVRSEVINYTLIASPGYIELIEDMVSLNSDIGNIAFVVGDTPLRMDPSSTSITSLVNNTSASGDTEESLTTSSPYLGVYYPWGRTTNTDGTTVVVPPSHMALRTIINSDNMSYPWYPPAGYTRGLVTNASAVGYLDSTTGVFTTVTLNQGQRDNLYSNAINPIAYMANKGLVIFGQKTRSGTTSAMDRINVARLMNYLSYQLSNLAKQFLFELNTSATRTNVQTSFDRFMSNMITLQAVTDYIVVCDTSNNTADTIDANELYIDIAVAPTKSIEFIYLPIRIVNTGTDMSSIYGDSSNTTSS